MNLLEDNLNWSIIPSEDLVENYLNYLFFDEKFIAYPYPLHNMLREYKNGIHIVNGFDNDRITVITRYDDVQYFLKSPNVERPRRLPVNERKQAEIDDPQNLVRQNAMFFISGEEHKRLRSFVSDAFQSSVVSTLEGRIRKICEDLIAAIKEKNQDKFDFVNDFGFPLPILVIMNLIGVPSKDIEKVRFWSGKMVVAFARVPIDEDQRKEVNEAILQCRDYFFKLMDHKKENTANDLLSRLVQVHGLTKEEIFGTVMITLIAGHETTTNAISTIILHLLRNQELFNLVETNKNLREQTIEELLRYEPPFAFMTRFVHEDFVYKDHHFTKGDQLYLHYAAANRDPRMYSQPNDINIYRKESQHFSFGRGSHYCLGAPLARLELQIAIDVLLPFLKNYKPDASSIKIKRTGEVRGLEQLIMSKINN